MTGRLLLAAVLIVPIGCRFDESGLAPGGDSGVLDDGALPPDARADAGPCPAQVHAEIAINGRTTPLGNGEPYAYVLVGDTIELSAAGSCSQGGPLTSYQWEITPFDGTRSTALPNLNAETITVYATDDVMYSVSLVVEDSGRTDVASVEMAFQASAFRTFDGAGSDEIRDLDAGDDLLWLASKGGAFSLRLDPLGATTTEVNTMTTGATIDTELQEAYYDADANLVWLAHKDARASVWKIDRNVAPSVVSTVDIDGLDALGAIAEVEDIARIADGLAVASKLGLTTSKDDETFSGKFAPTSVAVYAVDGDGDRQWAGGALLWNLAAAGAPLDPFGGAIGPDLKIRDLAVYPAANELWVATDGGGVARVDLDTGALIDHYTAADPGIEGDKFRALAVDAGGDVWAATDKGVSRFKRDRETWFTYGNSLGLQGLLDVKGITVDEAGGRRGIWVGTRGGLVYLVAE